MKDVAAEVRRESSLVQTKVSSDGTFKLKCRAMATVLRKAFDRVAPGNSTAAPPTNRDCDEMREELQDTFTDSVTKLGELYDEKDKEIADEKEICVEEAHDVFKEQEVIHEEEVKRASDAVAQAKAAIEELEPMLQDQKEVAERMRQHITEIKDTCVVSEDVTVYVEKVRDLIDKLEECPGRNDFWLKTPEWAPKDLHAANTTSPGLAPAAATTALGAAPPTTALGALSLAAGGAGAAR